MRVYLMISKNRRVMKGSTKMDLFEVGEVGVEPKKMFLDPEKKNDLSIKPTFLPIHGCFRVFCWVSCWFFGGRDSGWIPPPGQKWKGNLPYFSRPGGRFLARWAWNLSPMENRILFWKNPESCLIWSVPTDVSGALKFDQTVHDEKVSLSFKYIPGTLMEAVEGGVVSIWVSYVQRVPTARRFGGIGRMLFGSGARINQMSLISWCEHV